IIQPFQLVRFWMFDSRQFQFLHEQGTCHIGITSAINNHIAQLVSNQTMSMK
ncbi:unnamed protein product, partial [Musa textilis]